MIVHKVTWFLGYIQTIFDEKLIMFYDEKSYDKH